MASHEVAPRKATRLSMSEGTNLFTLLSNSHPVV